MGKKKKLPKAKRKVLFGGRWQGRGQNKRRDPIFPLRKLVQSHTQKGLLRFLVNSQDVLPLNRNQAEKLSWNLL